jgi:hypothetical protein
LYSFFFDLSIQVFSFLSHKSLFCLRRLSQPGFCSKFQPPAANLAAQPFSSAALFFAQPSPKIAQASPVFALNSSRQPQIWRLSRFPQPPSFLPSRHQKLKSAGEKNLFARTFRPSSILSNFELFCGLAVPAARSKSCPAAVEL